MFTSPKAAVGGQGIFNWLNSVLKMKFFSVRIIHCIWLTYFQEENRSGLAKIRRIIKSNSSPKATFTLIYCRF
jgi:hypothetical protein